VQRFASEPILATCMTYLAQYRTFDSDEQMKRIVALMHRQAVKAKADGLYYKVSVFSLFNQILDDHKTGKLARNQASGDLVKLIQYILRRFLKAAKASPLMMINVFYPSRAIDIRKMRKGIDLVAVQEDEVEHVHMPVEVDFRNEEVMTDSRKMGVAVAILQEKNQEYLLDWIKDVRVRSYLDAGSDN
jgi:replication fork protection complex subunit Tof1/Swi1